MKETINVYAIENKTSQKGNNYMSLKTDKGSMSVFLDEVKSEFDEEGPNKKYEVEYVQKDNYKTVMQIYQLLGTADAQSFQPANNFKKPFVPYTKSVGNSNPNDEKKQRSISKMAAVNAAVEIINTCNEVNKARGMADTPKEVVNPDTLAKVVITIAKELEAYYNE